MILCLSSVGHAQQAYTYFFPVIADGYMTDSPDMFYVTEFVLHNTSSRPASGTLNLYTSSGLRMEVAMRLTDPRNSTTSGSNSIWNVSINPSGTMHAFTVGLTPLVVGWAILQTDQIVDASAVFSINSRTNGMISEAAVPWSAAGTQQRYFVDMYRRDYFINQFNDPRLSNTGIAIANPHPTTAVSVNVRLMDSQGQTVTSTAITLPPAGAVSKFVNELFPNLSSNFEGEVEITSSLPVSTLSLRFTGLTFTTFTGILFQ